MIEIVDRVGRNFAENTLTFTIPTQRINYTFLISAFSSDWL